MWDDILIAAQMERIGINEIYSNFDKIPQIKRIF
jgi:predicted nucleic acid-binding protein